MTKRTLMIGMLMMMSIVACSTKKTTTQVPEKSPADELMDLTTGSEDVSTTNDQKITDADLGLTPSEPIAEAQPMEASLGMGQYTVAKGDTLMLISFKLYGDYRKWKELSKENPNINSSSLTEGQIISYQVPSQKFEWNPKGLPHLIQLGETLGSISHQKYGTTKKWKSIFENNKPMIIDPNVIFAGFTLYYIPGRDVASEIIDTPSIQNDEAMEKVQNEMPSTEEIKVQ